MNQLNVKREWSFITAATHNEKPIYKNFFIREILLALQILLSKTEVEKANSRGLFLKQIYFKTKKFYITIHKGHIYGSAQK